MNWGLVMTDNERSGRPDLDPVEKFFAAARSEAPVPSAALFSRMLEDAEKHQPSKPVMGPSASRRNRAGVWATLLAVFGGWRTVGGMAMAAAAGVWIGFSGVGGITDAASGYLGTVDALGTVELMPEGDVLAFAFELEG